MQLGTNQKKRKGDDEEEEEEEEEGQGVAWKFRTPATQSIEWSMEKQTQIKRFLSDSTSLKLLY